MNDADAPERTKRRAMAVTFEDVRRIALSLERVEESTSYGTPAFKVGGKLIARLKEDGDSLVVGTTFEERGLSRAWRLASTTKPRAARSRSR